MNANSIIQAANAIQMSPIPSAWIVIIRIRGEEAKTKPGIRRCEQAPGLRPVWASRGEVGSPLQRQSVMAGAIGDSESS